MPSIRDAIDKNINRIKAGGDTGTGRGTVTSTAYPTPLLDIPNGLPQRGMFPADIILASDRSDSSRAFRGAGVRSSTFPYPPQKVTVSTVKKVSSSTAASNSKSAVLKLQVNNIDNPDQELLNLLSGPNITLVQQPDGGVVITGSGGDGLIHGNTIWEIDSAYFLLRDNFYQNGNSDSTTAGTVGDLNWAWSSPSTTQIGGFSNYQAPYFSGTSIVPDNTVNKFGYIVPSWQSSLTQANPVRSPVWPLFDHPSWECTWVFQLDRSDPLSTSDTAFNSSPVLPNTSFYLGFVGWDSNTLITRSSQGARPYCFAGLRYDRDPGVTLTLTSVGNSSGGVAVYSGTITGGGTGGGFVGQKFTIAGFTASNNNGVFICTASTTSTITLANASATAETHAATAQSPSITDTTFKFEAVSNTMMNQYLRNNTQGNIYDTAITPAENVWYRLDMICTSQGQLQISLTGGGVTTGFQTLNIPQYSFTGATVTFNAGSNGPIQYAFSTSGLNNLVGAGEGTILNISGWSGGSRGSSFTETMRGFNDVTPRSAYDSQIGSTSSQGSAVFTFYPGFYPAVIFGNDSESSPAVNKSLIVNFFAFVWNPGVDGGSGTPNSLLPRYF